MSKGDSKQGQTKQGQTKQGQAPHGQGAKVDTAITPTRAEDYAEWYQQVVRAADLAENSPVRGCMVIKPWGYAHLGEHPARARRACSRRPATRTPTSRCSSRKSFLEKEAAARRGLRQGVRGRHPPPPRAPARRRPGPGSRRRSSRSRSSCARPPRPSSAHVRAVGAELPRPAAAHQPVGQRRALGDAHAPVPAHHRVPLAGGPHRARHRGRGRARRRCRCSTSTPTFAEDFMAMPVLTRPEDRERALPRRRRHVLHRGDDAGPQGAAGRHLALPRPELRQGERHPVPRRKDETEEHAWTTSWGVSTRLIGGADHDPRRRRRPRAARRASRPRTS